MDCKAEIESNHRRAFKKKKLEKTEKLRYEKNEMLKL